MTDSIAVFAVFDDHKDLRAGVKALNRLGFKKLRKSALSRSSSVQEDFKFENCTEISNGAWVGAIVGAAVGLFVGLYMDHLPLLHGAGFPPLVVVSFIVVLGSILGAGAGALVGIGTPELMSRRYARYMNQGHRVLSVHVDTRDEAKHVTEILYKMGGVEVVTNREDATLEAILKENPKRAARPPQQVFEHAHAIV